MPSKTPEKERQPAIKQTKDQHKGEFKADIYKPGLTAGMHGKAKGGHPTKRAEEMKGC